MESKPSFNFKAYQSKKFSRWYVFRVIFYIVVLTIGVYFLYNRFRSDTVEPTDPSLEFENIELEGES